MTREEAQQKLKERFHEYPFLGNVATSAETQEKLVEILSFENLDPTFYGLLLTEVQVVLALYAPLGELGKNIQKTLGVTPEIARRIASFIEILILEPVLDDLHEYEQLWNEELKKGNPAETSQNTPATPKESSGILSGTVPTPDRPLTRDELTKALGGSRTMVGDVARAEIGEREKDVTTNSTTPTPQNSPQITPRTPSDTAPPSTVPPSTPRQSVLPTRQ